MACDDQQHRLFTIQEVASSSLDCAACSALAFTRDGARGPRGAAESQAARQDAAVAPARDRRWRAAPRPRGRRAARRPRRPIELPRPRRRLADPAARMPRPAAAAAARVEHDQAAGAGPEVARDAAAPAFSVGDAAACSRPCSRRRVEDAVCRPSRFRDGVSRLKRRASARRRTRLERVAELATPPRAPRAASTAATRRMPTRGRRWRA